MPNSEILTYVGCVIAILAAFVVGITAYFKNSEVAEKERVASENAEIANKKVEEAERKQQAAEKDASKHRKALDDYMTDSRKADGDLSAKMDKLYAAIRPQPAGLANPELTPELVAMARELLDRGNSEQRVLALIALKDHEVADSLIQALKKAPAAEIVRLLTLEGENWYKNGEFDRAIKPLEQALALQPGNSKAARSAAFAHLQAQIGSSDGHVEAATFILDRALLQTKPGTTDWADMQWAFGVAWAQSLVGNRIENLRKSVACSEAAQTVFIKESSPHSWIAIEHNRLIAISGLAVDEAELNEVIRLWEKLFASPIRLDSVFRARMECDMANALGRKAARGDLGAFEKGLKLYENALALFRRTGSQKDLVRNLQQFALFWLYNPTGDKIACAQEAAKQLTESLKFLSREKYPQDWAESKKLLGTAYSRAETPDVLKRAIEAYNDSAGVYTRESSPVRWGEIQKGLAIVYLKASMRGTDNNLESANGHARAALEGLAHDKVPALWAQARGILGLTLARKSNPSREELGVAIDALKDSVRHKLERTDEWALSQSDLAFTQISRTWLAGLGNEARRGIIKDSISRLEDAVSLLSAERYAKQRPIAEGNLALARLLLAESEK